MLFLLNHRHTDSLPILNTLILVILVIATAVTVDIPVHLVVQEVVTPKLAALLVILAVMQLVKLLEPARNCLKLADRHLVVVALPSNLDTQTQHPKMK